jgi:nitronate monooxygenase
MRGIYRR